MGREKVDGVVEAFATAALGGIAAARGDFKKALSLQQGALAEVRKLGNRRAEARLLLALAILESYLDDRDFKASFARLSEARTIVAEAADLGLERDQALVAATVRYGSTNLRFSRDGDLDALRALKLSQRLADPLGVAAAWTLLGAYAQRLGRPTDAANCLTEAQRIATQAGFAEATFTSLQLRGEFEPDSARGIVTLRGALSLGPAREDPRVRAKTLSDLCRLNSGLGDLDTAWQMHQESAAAVSDYVEKRSSSSITRAPSNASSSPCARSHASRAWPSIG